MDLSLFPPFSELLHSTGTSLGLWCVPEKFRSMGHCSLRHVPLGGQQPEGTAPLEGTDPPSAPSHAQLAQGSYFLLGVSAKHFREDVSTTVSQNVTTGSAT